MKIKLNQEDTFYLCVTLADEVNFDMFSSKYEYDVTTAVLRDFIKRLSKRTFPEQNKASHIKLTQPEALALNRVMPYISSANTYTEAVLITITNEIDLLCRTIENI